MMDKQWMKIRMTSSLGTFIEQLGLQHKVEEILSRIFAIMDTFNGQVDRGIPKMMVLKNFYAEVDRIIQEESYSDDYTISCQKGCAFCCKMNVEIGSLEAEVLVEYAQQNNIPIDIAYLKRQSEIPPAELPFNPSASSCVFLTKDNSCGVYSVRPFVCRKYQVVTPAEKCNLLQYPEFRPTGPIYPTVEEIVSAVDSCDEAIGSMSKMVLEALKNKKKSHERVKE